mmetsp:Transcript_1512/g.2086  ORF Transcript_1512/g.2086 Transcript_1512/m.2086 type:complete len:1192 (-) Transcript_1512:114-3689(-)|eukprot:CAMPEP_0184492388 /NCGR_PEP_ID=MMETSP0113_2-20130426/23083_1 /TAXON_ID=91329 /ORGANISM="Norrisiella sphaerica, Strain BC52" /LENGTH=1191 /DNA_ID=CAMNT_0026877155 /DNA_START=119 /DNA_END=3694 /DNA_ORIENTATION=+
MRLMIPAIAMLASVLALLAWVNPVRHLASPPIKAFLRLGNSIGSGIGTIHLIGHPGGRFEVPKSFMSMLGAGTRSERLARILALEPKKDELSVLVHVRAGKVHQVRTRFDPLLQRSYFVPDNTFGIYAGKEEIHRMEAETDVLWIGHMRPEWKHHSDILRSVESVHPNALELSRVSLTVNLLTKSAAEAAKEWTDALNFSFAARKDDTIVVNVARSRAEEVILRLREDERVHWIEANTPLKMHNLGGTAALQAGRAAEVPDKIWSKGIRGEGELIHVHDSGLDMNHCMFSNFASNNSTPPVDCGQCGMENFYRVNLGLAREVQEATKNRVCNRDWWRSSYFVQSSHCPEPFNSDSCFTTRTRTRTNLELLNDALAAIEGEGSLSSFDAVDRLCPPYKDDANGYSCKLEAGVDLSLFEHAWKSTATLISLTPIMACESTPTAIDFEPRPVPIAPCIFTTPECTIPQTEQRKVQAHWSFADQQALDVGHGTHVAGSVVGMAEDVGSPLNRYKGMAHNASLVFSDASNTGGAVYTPPNIADLFKWGINMGASISTNSWGDSTNAYTTGTGEIDAIVHQNPDFLILFAAGNSGSRGYGTLGSQANAKNTLTVGAATQPKGYQLESPINVTRHFYRWEWINSVCRSTPSQQLFNILNSMISSRCGGSSDKLFASPASMKDYYCGQHSHDQIVDSNWKDYACNIGRVQGKDCPGSIRDSILKNLQTVQLPEGLQINVDKTCGNDMVETLDRETSNGEIGEFHMADFSSRGPTLDGRIKPDCVAPGKSVVSAAAAESGGSAECFDQTSFGDGDPRVATGTDNPTPGLADMSGTSMATPLTAGSAALVRQYYREGWAADGTKNPANGVIPSAALMKATLIASTVKVEGKLQTSTTSGIFCSSNSPCTEYKDAQSSDDFVFFYGHGHVKLADALAFQGDPHKLEYVMTSVPEKSMSCYNITFGEPTDRTAIRIVLAWTDWAGSPLTSKTLVNDLDLRLHRGDDVTLGNAQLTGSKCRDSRNNMESLEEGVPGNGTRWTVAVEAVQLNILNENGTQPFALAMVLPNTTSVIPLETCPDFQRFDAYECPGGDDEEDELSDAAVIGIVIGICIGGLGILALLCYGIYYCLCRPDPNQKGKTRENPQMEEAKGEVEVEEVKAEMNVQESGPQNQTPATDAGQLGHGELGLEPDASQQSQELGAA